jgi:hypothetical protein
MQFKMHKCVFLLGATHLEKNEQMGMGNNTLKKTFPGYVERSVI